MWWRKQQAVEERMLLVDLITGAVLKAHRDLDGTKIHKLHRSGQAPTVIDEQTVRRLEEKKLIQSNMKFPAATYLLTIHGVTLARELSGVQDEPVVVRLGRLAP